MVKLFTAESIKNFNKIQDMKSKLLSDLNYPDIASPLGMAYTSYIEGLEMWGDLPEIGEEDYSNRSLQMIDFLKLTSDYDLIVNFYECYPQFDPSFTNNSEDFESGEDLQQKYIEMNQIIQSLDKRVLVTLSTFDYPGYTTVPEIVENWIGRSEIHLQLTKVEWMRVHEKVVYVDSIYKKMPTAISGDPKSCSELLKYLRKINK